MNTRAQVSQSRLFATKTEATLNFLPSANVVPVYIWNTDQWITVDNSELISWLQSFFDADGIEYEDYVDCSKASAEAFALDDQITEMVNDSAQFSNAVDAINSQTTSTPCPWDDNRVICIDGYITDKVTWTGFLGDGRSTPDPNAPYNASRFQVKWNPDSNTASINVSMSSSLLPALFASVNVDLTSFAFAPPDTAESEAITFRESDSTRVIRIKAYDGYCNSLPTNVLGTNFLCPAAEFNMRLTKREGAWVIADGDNDVASNGYPSVDVWRHNSSGGFDLLRHDNQGLTYRLFQHSQDIKDGRSKRDLGLPPGCYYQ